MQTPLDEDAFDVDRPLPTLRAPVAMRGSGLVGILAVVAAVGGFGAWATIAPLDSAVVAQGKVTVAGKRKEVQHLDGGIVRKFLVKDGDHVKEGDILVEFDTLRPGTKFAVLRIAYFTALTAEARLTAERNGATKIAVSQELTDESTRDPEVKTLLDSQRQLLASRLNEASGETRILQSRIDRLKEQIRGLTAERTAVNRQFQMAQEEQKTLEALFKQQFTTRSRILTIKREVYDLEGSMGRLTSQIAGSNKEIDETDLTLAQTRKKRMTEVLSELRDTQSKVLDLREQYLASKDELARTVLRSPASGTVIGSKIHTIGGVVRGGETLLEIVPDQDQLVIEVKLRPQDVDEVQVKQLTEIRLSAFKQRTTPTLKGRVTFVSADTILEPRSPEPYYLASIEVDADELRHLGEQKLQPGMPAEALIKTGQRTAMAYLLQPLSDSFNRAWREH